MNADTYICGQLATYAMQQGLRHGGIASMQAIAHVIANRVRAGWYGGNWMQVLETAPLSEGNDYSADRLPINLQSLLVRKMLASVDDIYQHSETDVFSHGRALYFCDLTGVVAPWFVEKIVRQPEDHARIATVGPVSLFT